MYLRVPVLAGSIMLPCPTVLRIRDRGQCAGICHTSVHPVHPGFVCYKSSMRSHLSSLQNPDTFPELIGTRASFTLPSYFLASNHLPRHCSKLSFALILQDVLTIFVFLLSTSTVLLERPVASAEGVNRSRRQYMSPCPPTCLRNARVALSKSTS